jgi:hypothetical protein
METRKTLTILFMVWVLTLFVVCAGWAAPMGTGFTYQGRLIDANSAADGLYDFQFKLYDANVGGNKVSYDVNTPDVDVIDGYFTVSLDFGSVFDGNDRYLEIGVRAGELNDPNVYTVLSPRQQVTHTPYAIYAKNAGTVSGGITGSGTSNRIAKFTSGNTIGNSAVYENSKGRIGIRGAPFWGSQVP